MGVKIWGSIQIFHSIKVGESTDQKWRTLEGPEGQKEGNASNHDSPLLVNMSKKDSTPFPSLGSFETDNIVDVPPLILYDYRQPSRCHYF